MDFTICYYYHYRMARSEIVRACADSWLPIRHAPIGDLKPELIFGDDQQTQNKNNHNQYYYYCIVISMLGPLAGRNVTAGTQGKTLHKA